MLSFNVDQLSKLTPTQLAVAAALAVPTLLLLRVGYSSSVLSRATAPLEPDVTEDALRANKAEAEKEDEKKTSIMQSEVEGLARVYSPFTQEQLKPFDGSDPSKPIYVSIKDVYGFEKSYNIFAGKDGSKGLGMSSLKPEHAVPDFSDLPDNERKVLDDWHSFFLKRYDVVGYVVDMPDAVKKWCDSPEKRSKL